MIKYPTGSTLSRFKHAKINGKCDDIFSLGHRAVVVALLVERSLLTPEIRGSNPNIGKVLSTNCKLTRKDKNKEKEAGMAKLKIFLPAVKHYICLGPSRGQLPKLHLGQQFTQGKQVTV